ncbi:MAG: GNAT family N-acetyltransferase [Oceanospirillaceae bacterium]
MIEIREAVIEDAAALINLRKCLFRETQYLLLEPDEYSPSVESEAGFIKSFIASNNSSIFLAFNENSKLIGFMGVAGGATIRTKHKATVFMGILQSYWGKGIGRRLFEFLFVWAKSSKLIRLELTTALKNKRAFSLYQSVGFQKECIKIKNIIINNEPVDEYQMFYILPSRYRN